MNESPDSYQCYRDLLGKYYAANGELQKWRWFAMTLMMVVAALTVALLVVTR